MLDCVLNDEMHVWNDFLAVPVCNFDSRNHLGKGSHVVFRKRCHRAHTLNRSIDF